MKLEPLNMKPLSWVRFSWDLTKLPVDPVELPDHYEIGRANKNDDQELRKVFSSSFLLDPIWNPAIGEVMRKVQSWLDCAFDSEKNACLALRHGTRIIGATVLSLDPNADNHLAPGPSVLMEYRNRGFGTRLLQSSLNLLREAGLSRATGIARDVAPATKFLYPKFNGHIELIDIAALMAA
jgi:hypothetical protein